MIKLTLSPLPQLQLQYRNTGSHLNVCYCDLLVLSSLLHNVKIVAFASVVFILVAEYMHSSTLYFYSATVNSFLLYYIYNLSQ